MQPSDLLLDGIADNGLHDVQLRQKGEPDLNAENELKQRKKQLASLLLLHMKNFQQTITTSRRRSQQRISRRQGLLRNLYMKQLMQMQTNYLDMYITLSKKRFKTNENIQNTRHSVGNNEDDACKSFITQWAGKDSEEQWLHDFRMTRSQYYWLCGQLCDYFSIDGLKPEELVALGLYVLAHGDANTQHLVRRFRLFNNINTKSTIRKYLKQFARVLLARLGHMLLILPQNENQYDDIRSGFHRLTNMPPAIVGVISVVTLPLLATAGADDGYMRLEALVDDCMLFRKLQISSRPTPALFSESKNELTDLRPQLINERHLPCFVLAPVQQNYPLRPWLLQRYMEPLAPHEYDFNEAADNLQDVGDKALLRLFSRWQFLSRHPLTLKPDVAALVATACCALHNLLEELGAPYMQEWQEATDIGHYMHGEHTPKPDDCTSAEDALDMRDFLARTISSTEV